jgi:hypothetical protein
MAGKVCYRKNRFTSYEVVRDEDFFVDFAVDFDSSLGRTEQSIGNDKWYAESLQREAMLVGEGGVVDGVVPSANV